MIIAFVVIVGWQFVTLRIWGRPPRADAGQNAVYTATSPQGAQVELDGSRSMDVDSSPETNDDIVSYEWFANYKRLDQESLARGQWARVTLPVGEHSITLVVRDRKGNPAEDAVVITVAASAEAGTTPAAKTPAAPSTPGAIAAPAEPASPVAVEPKPAVTQGIEVVGGDAVTTAVLGSEDPADKYNLAVYLTSEDGCVLAADVTEGARKPKYRYQYRQSIDADAPYPLLRMLDAEKGEPADVIGEGISRHPSMSTELLRIFRGDEVTPVPLTRVNWDLRMEEDDNAQRAVFSITIRENGKDLLRLEKILTLAHSRYDLELTHRVHNLTREPLKVSLVQFGPSGMHREDARTDYRKIVTVFETPDGQPVPTKTVRKDAYKQSDPVLLADDRSENRLVYAALANKYFACYVGPGGDVATQRNAWDEVVAIADMPSDDANADLTTRWTALPFDVPAGTTQELHLDMYWGPKAKRLLESDEMYVARFYDQTLAVEYNYCCIPGIGLIVVPLAHMLTALLNGIYFVLPNYGVAIIIMVLLVRLVLHPVTKKGQVSMMKMQKEMSRLQPKMEAIKKQYANDKQKQQQATMELYREEGVNPAGQIFTFLPMMLQLPVWIALWTTLNTTIELRHQPFVFWIRDLAGPDALLHFSETSWIYQNTGWLPLIGPLVALNILPLVLGVSMYFQQKFGPKPVSPGSSTDQMRQQKMMMNFMSVFLAVMFYSMPAGLNLYIGASNVFGVLEMWRIRKHLQDADATPSRPAPTPPVGGLARKPKKKEGWFARILHQAEDARKLQSKKKR